MDALEILAETRLQLRGSAEPVPDPMPNARATRKAMAALDRLDIGEKVYVSGYGVRRVGDQYQFGPLDPVDCAEALLQLFDLYGGRL